MALSKITASSIADNTITPTQLGSITSALPTGSVLQTLQANKTDKQLIESTSFVDILSQSITPSATSSGVLIMAYVCLLYTSDAADE